MNQNLKNTVYRFKTMRAPEFIGEEEKENYFIKRPVGVTSMFKGVTLRSQEFVDKTQNYQLQYNDINSLKSTFGAFYTFAIWLTKNRTSVTEKNASEKFSSIGKYSTGLDTSVLEGLWNDLHYLTSQNSNSHLRDAIISILAADFFYKKVIQNNANDLDDATIQRIAKARIILDLTQQNNGSNTPIPEAVTPNYRNSLEKAKRFLNSKNEIENQAAFLNTLTELEKTYQRKLATSKAEYDQTYQEQVDNAYKNATKVERIVTEKETEKTSVVVEYENLNLPTYDFKPAPELDINVEKKPSFLSDENLTDLESLKQDYGYTTFKEVKEHAEQKYNEAQNTNLKHAPKPEKQVAYKGVVLPKTTVTSRPTNLEFCFAVGQRNELKMSFITSVPNTSYVVSDMDYTLKFRDSTENSNEVYSLTTDNDQGDTILTAELYPNNRVSIIKLPDTFECTVNFTNGESFNFTYQFDDFLSLEKCSEVPISWFYNDNGGTPMTEQPIIYGLQRVGIVDYRKVEQEICCYVPGEVSHIENIMAREYKDRSTSRSRTQEVTNTVSSETEREQLTDTTSTDRFEMNQEMASLVAQDQSTAVNAGISYNGAKINAFANASFANNTSTEESNTQAITHAQELTERALDRVTQKVKEERVVKIVESYEESNSHGFDNRKGNSHISGVYRWVDKIYKNQIHNYGKRLMYEFMVPEPASFHNLAATITVNNGTGQELVKPVDPRSDNAPNYYRITNPEDITDGKAKYWAGIYNIEIEPRPLDNITIGESNSATDVSGTHAETISFHGKVNIPEGYIGISTRFSLSVHEVADTDDWTFGSLKVGDINKASRGLHAGFHIHNDSTYANAPLNEVLTETYTSFINPFKEEVPFSVSASNARSANINVSVKCTLSSLGLDSWLIKTFNTIIEAYENAKAAYDEKLADLDTETSRQLEINPGFYRKIENDVLRKNCIAYLIGHSNLGKAMITGSDVTSITPIQNQDLNDYAETIKFFEQAFEWDIMSYYFYPFYWSKKETWAMKYQIENNDPLFRAFLQSGMARVIVTVRPGFEEAVNWYLATGQIWNGGQVPTIDDDEFISIVEELQNPVSVVEGTWETRVPTSLTVIQAGSIGLNVEGLPCNTDCENSGLFDSDENPIAQTDELIGGEEGIGKFIVS